MSCRKSDKTALIGCKIGDVALRGCGRGCCPYSDSEISDNTRNHPMSGKPEFIPPEFHPIGRDGLYFHQCASPYRPKFICPGCRRSIKPAYDPKYEYRISDFHEWSVRESSPVLAAAFQHRNRLNSKAFAEERGKLYELRRKEARTAEETQFIEERDPEMWWTDVVRRDSSILRCPGCAGEVIRVGSNFRIPKKKDEKAWREIEGMIAEGIDMNAKFSPCPTVGEWKSMVEELQAGHQGALRAESQQRLRC